MKKLFILLLCIALIASGFNASSSATNGQEEKYVLNDSCEFDSVRLENELFANKALSKLILAFSNLYPAVEKDADSADYTYDGLSIEQYPEYYGGAYINRLGNLVILLTDMNKKEFVTSLIETDNVEFQEAFYSRKYLLSILDTIAVYYNTSDNPVSSFSSAKLDDYNNCVRVYLCSLNEAEIDDFKNNIITSDAIVFCEEQKQIEPETAFINLGSAISTSYGTLSLGFRCKRTNSLGIIECGFVTAKHGFDDINNWVNYGQSTLGERTLSYNLYDCAFVKITNSNYQAYNEIGNTGKTLSSSQLGTFAQGTTVYKYGISTYETSGIVEYQTISFSFSGSTYVFPDAFQSTYSSSGGDSGGPVYVYGTNVFQYLIGMHVSSGGLAQKAANIISIMYLTQY